MVFTEEDYTGSHVMQDDFIETGHDRGCGPSLFPDQARVDVSVSLELERWLRETAFEYDMTRAELIRSILRRARRFK